MAIVRLRGGGSPGYGNRNGNAPNTTASTQIFLVRAQAYADYGCLSSLNTGTAGGICGISSGGVFFISHTTAGSANVWTDGFTGWTWFALVWDTGTMRTYYQRLTGGDTTFHTGVTLGSAGLTGTTDLTFGSDLGISGILDEYVDVASIKVFSSVLNTAQLQARMTSRLIEPGLGTGLIFHSTCLSSADFALDRSSTGNLTITGTVTESSDDPGVPFALSTASLTTTATVSSTATGGSSLASSPSSTATVAGSLGHTLDASASTTASASGTLAGTTALATSVSTTATASGTVTGAGAVGASPDTTATATGELEADGELESGLSTSASLSGALAVPDSLAASLSTTAGLTAARGAVVNIAAVLATTAGLTANTGNEDDYYPSPDVDEAVKSPYPPDYVPDPDEPEYVNDPPDGG